MDLVEDPTSMEGISSASQQNNANTQVIQSQVPSDAPTIESSESGNQLVLTAATPEQLVQLSQHIHSEQDTQNAIALFRTTLDYALELHSHTSTFFQATTLTFAHHEHLTSLCSIQDELKTLPPRLEEADKTKLVRTRVNIRNSIATMKQAIDNLQQSSSKGTSTNGDSSHFEDPANTVTAEMKNLHSKLVRNRQLVRQAEVDKATTSNQYYAASEKCAKLKNAQQELLTDFTRQFGMSYEDFLDQHPDCSQSYSEAAKLQAPSLPTGTHVPDFTAITPRKSSKSVSFRPLSLTRKKRSANKRSETESSHSDDSDGEFRIRKRSRHVSRTMMISPGHVPSQVNPLTGEQDHGRDMSPYRKTEKKVSNNEHLLNNPLSQFPSSSSESNFSSVSQRGPQCTPTKTQDKPKEDPLETLFRIMSPKQSNQDIATRTLLQTLLNLTPQKDNIPIQTPPSTTHTHSPHTLNLNETGFSTSTQNKQNTSDTIDASKPPPKLWETVMTTTTVDFRNLQPPKFQLGLFDGTRIAYRPFIENFRLYVHDRNDISVPQKVCYLEESLPQNILQYIKHYPATTEGYILKLKYLDDHFGDDNATKEEVWRTFLALRPKSTKIPDIKECYEKAKYHISLLKLYYGTDVRLDHLRSELCRKFPPFLYETRINPADHSLQHLMDCIELTLKAKDITYQSHKNSDNRKYHSEKPDFTPHPNFHTNPIHSTGKKGNQHDKYKNKNSQNKNRPKQTNKTNNIPYVNTHNFQEAIVNTNAKLNFSVLQPPLKMLPERVLDIPDKPLKGDCYLCRRLDHWSFLCTEKATLQQREDVYKERGACTSCARTHTGVCTQKPRHVCNWFHCSAVDQHHTALCPVAPYPITQEKVTQWYRQLHALQKLYPTERLRKRKEQSRQQ